MSNERIDLTQFEGIKEWEVEKRPDGGYAIKTGRDNFSLEEAETIVKLPTLIAELKRCCEEITLAHRNLSIVRNALARGYPDIEEEIWKLIDASE
jgi:hypothetical protein